MAWSPMYDVMQWVDANGDPASGYVLKAYLPGTTTATNIAIDKDGGSPQATITLNAEGKPEVSGNEVVPFIDRNYKWAIFENATDAAANSNPYAGFYDNIPQVGRADEVSAKSYATMAAAVADIGNQTIGSTIYIQGRTSTGDHGASHWNIVDESTVTENEQDIVTGDSDKSLQIVIEGKLNPMAVGANGDGSTDDAAILTQATTLAPLVITKAHKCNSSVTFTQRVDVAGGSFVVSVGTDIIFDKNETVHVDWFGAVPDAQQVSDGAITSSDATFTSTAYTFTSSDVGKGIAVFNAGSTTTSLITTIATFTDSNTVELAASAGTTVSSAVTQIGTNNTNAFLSAIDSVHASGGGTVKAAGPYFCETKVQLRADNVVYDFRDATFYGNNFSALDDSDTTHKPTNIRGYGGSFNPIGDTAAFGGNVNYNGLAFVHADKVDWRAPRVTCRDGTRAISVQANGAHGASPFVNLTNIRITDVAIFGDGNTHDGVDITSSTDGVDMIQDVYISGYVQGCKRGLNNSPGSSSLRHLRVDLDLTIRDPDTMGAVTKFTTDSRQNFVILDATTDGIDIRGPEECEFNVYCSGTGASLNDAIVFVDNSADTSNTVDAHIGYDGTNLWTRGLVPSLNDLFIKSAYIEGCTTGYDDGGFRTINGNMTFRNCTTNIDNPDQSTAYWIDNAVDLGAGANPKLVAESFARPGANQGNASATLTVGTDERQQRWTTTLTTARDADLQTAGAYKGAKFHITRSASGGFNLQVKQDGGSTIKNVAASQWIRMRFDGSNWYVEAFGSL